MTDLEKAARMALDQLVSSTGELHFRLASPTDMQLIKNHKAITALRRALEQPAQQLVDWEAVAADQAMTIAMMKSEMQQQQVDDDRVMTVVYRNVQKEDAQSFMDHPKAVWFGWCHAPYQRDDARYKLEKAVTSPQPSKPWEGLTDEDIHALMNEFFYKGMQPSGAHFANFARAIEAMLREKNA